MESCLFLLFDDDMKMACYEMTLVFFKFFIEYPGLEDWLWAFEDTVELVV